MNTGGFKQGSVHPLSLDNDAELHINHVVAYSNDSYRVAASVLIEGSLYGVFKLIVDSDGTASIDVYDTNQDLLKLYGINSVGLIATVRRKLRTLIGKPVNMRSFRVSGARVKNTGHLPNIGDYQLTRLSESPSSPFSYRFGVEVFSAGNQTSAAGISKDWTTNDIDRMIANFNSGLPHYVPLKIGHTSDAFNERVAKEFNLPLPLITGESSVNSGLRDGQLSMGRIISLYRDGDTLLSNWEIPTKLNHLIRDGMLKSVSSEIFAKYKNNDGPVLSAVALLGAERPAVSTLQAFRDDWRASGYDHAPDLVTSYAFREAAGEVVKQARQAGGTNLPGRSGMVRVSKATEDEIEMTAKALQETTTGFLQDQANATGRPTFWTAVIRNFVKPALNKIFRESAEGLNYDAETDVDPDVDRELPPEPRPLGRREDPQWSVPVADRRTGMTINYNVGARDESQARTIVFRFLEQAAAALGTAAAAAIAGRLLIGKPVMKPAGALGLLGGIFVEPSQQALTLAHNPATPIEDANKYLLFKEMVDGMFTDSDTNRVRVTALKFTDEIPSPMHFAEEEVKRIIMMVRDGTISPGEGGDRVEAYLLGIGVGKAEARSAKSSIIRGAWYTLAIILAAVGVGTAAFLGGGIGAQTGILGLGKSVINGLKWNPR